MITNPAPDESCNFIIHSKLECLSVKNDNHYISLYQKITVLISILTHDELRVQQIHGFIFPGVLWLQIHRVTNVLHSNVEGHCQQDGVLKAKHQLDRGTTCDGGVIGVVHQHKVQQTQ